MAILITHGIARSLTWLHPTCMQTGQYPQAVLRYLNTSAKDFLKTCRYPASTIDRHFANGYPSLQSCRK